MLIQHSRSFFSLDVLVEFLLKYFGVTQLRFKALDQ